jgi:hypothetical protein
LERLLPPLNRVFVTSGTASRKKLHGSIVRSTRKSFHWISEGIIDSEII